MEVCQTPHYRPQPTEPYIVHKGLKFLRPIKDSFELHPAFFVMAYGELAFPSNQYSDRNAPLINFPTV